MKTIISTFSILVLAILFSNATNISPKPRIIGGELARVGQFTFAAAVYVQTDTGRFFCGGALTGRQYIITSGTCVNNAKLFTVQLGSNTLTGDDPNRQIFATSTYFLHPDFNPETLENDIGIIKLREPIMMNGYIMPIYLSSTDVKLYTQTMSLGFGQTSDDSGELSNDLRYIIVSTLTNEKCKTYYGNQITDNMICAGGSYNEGICHGDNGGPLIIASGKQRLIVGVASFFSGYGCESVYPSGYTRLYPYRDWVHNITERFS